MGAICSSTLSAKALSVPTQSSRRQHLQKRSLASRLQKFTAGWSWEIRHIQHFSVSLCNSLETQRATLLFHPLSTFTSLEHSLASFCFGFAKWFSSSLTLATQVLTTPRYLEESGLLKAVKPSGGIAFFPSELHFQMIRWQLGKSRRCNGDGPLGFWNPMEIRGIDDPAHQNPSPTPPLPTT